MTTATTLRAEAARYEQEARDSFERCDTDGFLSQWASGLYAQLKREQADILDKGGLSDFLGLYDGERRIPARLIDSKFGTSWLLRDEADVVRYGRKFLPFGPGSKIQRKLGLTEAREMAPAGAKITGRGHGLSGSAWVATFRTGCRWGTDARKI